MKKLSNTALKQKNRKALPPIILKKTPHHGSKAGKSTARLALEGKPLGRAAMPRKKGKLTGLKDAVIGIAKASVIKTASRALHTPSKTAGKESGKIAATELTDKLQASSKKQPIPQKSAMKSSAATKKSEAARPSGKVAAPSKPAAGAKAGAAPTGVAKGKKPGTGSKSANGRARAAGVLRNGAAGADSHIAEAVCREVACEGLATTGGYCRLHYIKNWKKIKRKEQILSEGKLNQYIEELVAKYPDKYIEAIRQDLSSEKEFAKVIYDLDLDESVDEFDIEGETVDSLIDTIKRDFDDEGETGF